MTYRIVVAEIGTGGAPIIADFVVTDGVLVSVKKNTPAALLALSVIVVAEAAPAVGSF